MNENNMKSIMSIMRNDIKEGLIGITNEYCIIFL